MVHWVTSVEKSDRYSIVLTVKPYYYDFKKKCVFIPQAIHLDGHVINGTKDHPAKGFQNKGRYYRFMREKRGMGKNPEEWTHIFRKTGHRLMHYRRQYEWVGSYLHDRSDMRMTDDLRNDFKFFIDQAERGLATETKL